MLALLIFGQQRCAHYALEVQAGRVELDHGHFQVGGRGADFNEDGGPAGEVPGWMVWRRRAGRRRARRRRLDLVADDIDLARDLAAWTSLAEKYGSQHRRAAEGKLVRRLDPHAKRRGFRFFQRLGNVYRADAYALDHEMVGHKQPYLDIGIVLDHDGLARLPCARGLPVHINGNFNRRARSDWQVRADIDVRGPLD